MKFLCTKVKQSWLTSPQNIEKVKTLGLTINDSFIGIQIKNNEPTNEEYSIVNNAIDGLFSSHKKAFPIRLIEL